MNSLEQIDRVLSMESILDPRCRSDDLPLLTDVQKQFYYGCVFNRQIYSNGFDGFFLNYLDIARFMPQSLEMLGLPHCARICRDALSELPPEILLPPSDGSSLSLQELEADVIARLNLLTIAIDDEPDGENVLDGLCLFFAKHQNLLTVESKQIE